MKYLYLKHKLQNADDSSRHAGGATPPPPAIPGESAIAPRDAGLSAAAVAEIVRKAIADSQSAAASEASAKEIADAKAALAAKEASIAAKEAEIAASITSKEAELEAKYAKRIFTDAVKAAAKDRLLDVSDIESMKLDGVELKDGEVVGLKEYLDTLQAKKPYLFKEHYDSRSTSSNAKRHAAPNGTPEKDAMTMSKSEFDAELKKLIQAAK